MTHSMAFKQLKRIPVGTILKGGENIVRTEVSRWSALDPAAYYVEVVLSDGRQSCGYCALSTVAEVTKFLRDLRD